MSDETPIDDDEQKRLMQSLDKDAAPVDEQRIQDGIAAATEVFESQVEISAGGTGPTVPRRSPMLVLAKPLAVLTAAAVALFVVLLPSSSTAAAARPALGDVLDNTLLSAIELRVAKDSREDRVWVRSGSVRWETTRQQYMIAAGSRLWEVDEAAGSVTTSDSKWWASEEKQVDLLALLGASTSDEIRRLRPTDTEDRNGVQCHVYEFTSDGMIVRAWADAQTNALHTVAAWTDAQAVKTQLPVSELRLVKRNAVIDEAQFVVGGKLSVDGRIGRIVDHQGIVSLRPLTHSRWTPVAGSVLMKPGDWLRTDVRGANAVTVELVSNYRIIVGPGSQVELAQPNTVVLRDGEVQIIGSGAANKPIELLGPDRQSVSIQPDQTVFYRLSRTQTPDAGPTLMRIEQKPTWLAGYEGASSEQSIGSLIANVDGRNTPLTVGYHKVNVEIRDQIARTTIEESFVNHTPGRLEGTFHFPLPQDASISGFGMWIGGELIEADVVEKQRAREIYETILRENRDPGLLEWTGGNIFKARVFPIEPHSEKRIKIVYTQVLPLRAQKFRYSYGLRSELLQKHPLRELSVNVLVNSALPLKAVTCATHPARVQQTEHSGRVEFSAQEYTPERDFEIVCELDTQQSDVVVVPHQRGDDGYFLAQVMPPSPEGNWQRDVLPDGSPLNVLLVCDTSGSMDSQQREIQQQFVSSLLNALGDKDRFNIAVCDVECEWQLAESVEVSEDSRKKAVDWLEGRRSLGWTDLDALAESVSARVAGVGAKRNPGSEETDHHEAPGASLRSSPGHPHVIYIGDGIVTAGDADAQAFVTRWKRKMNLHGSATFHAVSVGSSFESTVLKAIASVGGGSVRQVSGEQTPARVARELLNEIAQPGLRDLQVEFKGIQVAAVYPETLPNLAAGTQQIIVGRYLPSGEQQTGQMIVTGLRNAEPVKYVSQIQLGSQQGVAGFGAPRNPGGDDSGASLRSSPGHPSHENSFIPRLWARAHLDHLLEEGTGSFIRDQIIAMSEEFHIITPYTSLLVLETDADRERFGVKRRFLMRDGERFFADGRSSGNFELVQQQMKAAGNWRLGMRSQILQSLSKLGRNESQVSQRRRNEWSFGRVAGGVAGNIPFGGRDGLRSHTIRNGRQSGQAGTQIDLLIDGKVGKTTNMPAPVSPRRYELNGAVEGPSVISGRGNSYLRDDIQYLPSFPIQLVEELKRAKQLIDTDEIGFRRIGDTATQTGSGFINNRGRRKEDVVERFSVSNLSFALGDLTGHETNYDFSIPTPQRRAYGFSFYVPIPGNDSSWLDQLYPVLSASPEDQPPIPEADWPDEALAISQALIQLLTLEDSTGLSIEQVVRASDPSWKRQTSQTTTTHLHSPQQWLTWSHTVGQQTLVNWCDESTRGVWSTMFDLGRTRESTANDLNSMTPGNRPHAVTPLHQSYRHHTAEVQPQDGDTVMLVLTPRSGSGTLTFVIDTKRNIVLRAERKYDQGSVTATEYSDHIQIAGVWWPQTIRSLDTLGRETSVTRQTIDVLVDAAFQAAMAASLPSEEVQLISEPLPTYRDAKIAAEDGSAEFEHHLVLMLDASTTQNWGEVLAQHQELEDLAGDLAGMTWVRQSVLQMARRNEESRQVLRELADRTLKDNATSQDGSALLKHRSLAAAKYIINHLRQVANTNEELAVLGELRPVWVSQPEHVNGESSWKTWRANLLQRLGRVDEMLALRKEVANTAPWDVDAQRDYSNALFNAGEREAAYGWLRRQLDEYKQRAPHDRNQLRDIYANLLSREHRPDDLVTFINEWLGDEPPNDQPYRMLLSALIKANRLNAADNIAAEWLNDGLVAEEHSAVQQARVSAAIRFAQGRYHDLSSYHPDPKWLDPLLNAARFWLPHDHHFRRVTRIVNRTTFRNSDQGDLFRSEIARRLLESDANLPVARLNSYIGWANESHKVSTEQWQHFAGQLRIRWDNETDPVTRRQLGKQLTTMYSQHEIDQHLPFLRTRLRREAETEEGSYVVSAAQRLFSALLKQTWKIEFEAEALALLPQLSSGQSGSARLAIDIQHLRQFVDAMLKKRESTARAALQAEEHPEELTRQELAARHAAIRKEAIEGVIASLQSGREKLSQSSSNSSDDEVEQPEETLVVPTSRLQDWFNVERMYLDLQLGRKQDVIVDNCWELVERLAFDPNVVNEDTEIAPDQLQQLQLANQLRSRVMTMITWLAVQRAAPKSQQERLRSYINEHIADSDPADTFWKSQLIILLIALDEPDELEQQLKEWIRGDEYPVAWQLMLGRLLAEQGQLNEAIALFEGTQRRQQLSPADQSLLTAWYMATDRRGDYERSRFESFLVMDGRELQQWIGRKRQVWHRVDGALPTQLDEKVLYAFQALFEKSSQPGNYINDLQAYYSACRDFRLLEMIPDSVIGRTPQQVYPFLATLHNGLLHEIRNESTADEILKRIDELRADTRARVAGVGATRNPGRDESEDDDSGASQRSSPGHPKLTSIDLRALDLLEAILERRSADVLNQPGPHVDKAVAAMKRAFERTWANGEERQMALLLDRFGHSAHEPLEDERVRQLQVLHDRTESGTDDRVVLANILGNVLFYSHNRKEDGLAVQAAAITDYEQAHPDGWPSHLNNVLWQHLNLLESLQHYAAAEEVLDRQIAAPPNPAQREQFVNRRVQTWLSAFRSKGTVSLGSGQELYSNVLKRLLIDAKSGTDNARNQSMSRVVELFRIAKDIGQPYRSDLRKYAFEQFPILLDGRQSDYTSLVSQLADTLEQLIDVKTALEFLVARMEQYPASLQVQHNNAWQEQASRLGKWRQEAGHPEAGLIDERLESRILALVIAELKRDLTSRQQINRVIYHVGSHSYFWSQKADTFAAAVEEVLKETSSVFTDETVAVERHPLTSGQRNIVYAAHYLYGGLHRYDRAIEIMFVAHQHGLLDVSQQVQLCSWLHSRNRHAESIPLLEPIVAAHPDIIDYRVQLLTGYHHSGRPQQRDELLAATDAHFRLPGRWTESNIAALAHGCVHIELHEQAIGYYDELIPLHQRSWPNRGVGNGTLSGYYRNLARSCSHLGQTKRAVDGASAAVVSWGRSGIGRQEALSELRQIFQRATDLDEYVASLDEESAATGQDSPLLRKQIGIVYHSKGLYDKAITQLNKSLALQPYDLETHETLLKCYDILKDNAAAVEQLLTMIEIDRHNLKKYEQLAERLKDDPKMSERATTSLVEAGVTEAENHQALAELRQNQDRWQDAIQHWQHVARLRSLEPTGLVHLAKAQIHEKDWRAARDSLKKLTGREWPGRFDNVQNDIRELQQLMP